MLYILSNTNEPYHNIASEEYLLKNFTEDIFYLYINSPSIVVGKHQNAIAEADMNFVYENNLKIIRRISGGGTVYHDEGNLNFCFIKNIPDKKDISFRLFTSTIIDALVSMGIDAKHSRKSDINIKHNKISGNAMHVYKNRVLEHGTLLFSSNLDNLRKALKDSSDKFRGKAVKSVRSHVANIYDHTEQKLTINEFADKIFTFVTHHFPDSRKYTFNENDNLHINKLVKEKYSTWQWNFGYSPKYKINSQIKLLSDIIYISITVDKGFIRDPEIRDNNNRKNVCLEEILNGIKHVKKDIIDALNSHNDTCLPEGFDIYEFANNLF